MILYQKYVEEGPLPSDSQCDQKTLLSAFVLSKLDYCNSLLCGSPQFILDKLQRGQNSAEKLVHPWHLTMTAHAVNLIRTADFELRRIDSVRHYLSVQVTKLLFRLLFFHGWTIAIPSFSDAPSTF